MFAYSFIQFQQNQIQQNDLETKSMAQGIKVGIQAQKIRIGIAVGITNGPFYKDPETSSGAVVLVSISIQPSPTGVVLTS